MQILEHAPLGPLTTFKIGGSARFLIRVGAEEELLQALTFAKTKQLRFFILGGGSNVLVDDAGFDGVVIKIEYTGATLDGTLLIAAAGESWDGVVARAVENNLWGMENLSGVPGTVGGAAVQNIGAYGAALSQTVEWADVFDVRTEQVKRFTNKECAFGYRTSALKRAEGRYIVLRVAFRLQKYGKPNLSYKDLSIAFATVPAPSLLEIRTKVLEIRAKKFPDLAREGTAGSFFMNPILSLEEAKQLRTTYADMPIFFLPESSGIKVPLAWIFDKALHLHGTRVGSARLFEAQPLVIAVTPPASSHDVIALATQVQEKVFTACGIKIEPEVYILSNT